MYCEVCRAKEQVTENSGTVTVDRTRFGFVSYHHVAVTTVE